MRAKVWRFNLEQITNIHGLRQCIRTRMGVTGVQNKELFLKSWATLWSATCHYVQRALKGDTAPDGVQTEYTIDGFANIDGQSAWFSAHVAVVCRTWVYICIYTGWFRNVNHSRKVDYFHGQAVDLRRWCYYSKHQQSSAAVSGAVASGGIDSVWRVNSVLERNTEVWRWWVRNS